MDAEASLRSAFERHFPGAEIAIRDEGPVLSVAFACAGFSATRGFAPDDDPDTFVLDCLEMWEAYYDGLEASGGDLSWLTGGDAWG